MNSTQENQNVQSEGGEGAEIADRLNCYVINLDRSVDRMERFKESFESFPIPFIRIPAVDGKNLSFPVEIYDAFTFFVQMGRDALPGEIGCYLSHLTALEMFLESDKEFAMICEDDAKPIPECYEVIEQAISHSTSWNLLRLYGGRSRTTFPYQKLLHSHHLSTSITSMSGAVAYIVNRVTAEIFARQLRHMTAAYDDAIFYGRLSVKEATVFPNCCVLQTEYDDTTIRPTEQDKHQLKRKLKPWNLVFWTCRFYRLRVRTVRYLLQLLRILGRLNYRTKSRR